MPVVWEIRTFRTNMLPPFSELRTWYRYADAECSSWHVGACLPNVSQAKFWFYSLFCCLCCRPASSEGKCMCFWRWLYVVSMVSGGGRKKNIFQITRVRFYDLCVVISVSAAHVLALQGSALITPPVSPPLPQNLYCPFQSRRSLSLPVLSPWLAMILFVTARW